MRSASAQEHRAVRAAAAGDDIQTDNSQAWLEFGGKRPQPPSNSIAKDWILQNATAMPPERPKRTLVVRRRPRSAARRIQFFSSDQDKKVARAWAGEVVQKHRSRLETAVQSDKPLSHLTNVSSQKSSIKDDNKNIKSRELNSYRMKYSMQTGQTPLQDESINHDTKFRGPGAPTLVQELERRIREQRMVATEVAVHAQLDAERHRLRRVDTEIELHDANREIQARKKNRAIDTLHINNNVQSDIRTMFTSLTDNHSQSTKTINKDQQSIGDTETNDAIKQKNHGDIDKSSSFNKYDQRTQQNDLFKKPQPIPLVDDHDADITVKLMDLLRASVETYQYKQKISSANQEMDASLNDIHTSNIADASELLRRDIALASMETSLRIQRARTNAAETRWKAAMKRLAEYNTNEIMMKRQQRQDKESIKMLHQERIKMQRKLQVAAAIAQKANLKTAELQSENDILRQRLSRAEQYQPELRDVAVQTYDKSKDEFDLVRTKARARQMARKQRLKIIPPVDSESENDTSFEQTQVSTERLINENYASHTSLLSYTQVEAMTSNTHQITLSPVSSLSSSAHLFHLSDDVSTTPAISSSLKKYQKQMKTMFDTVQTMSTDNQTLKSNVQQTLAEYHEEASSIINTIAMAYSAMHQSMTQQTENIIQENARLREQVGTLQMEIQQQPRVSDHGDNTITTEHEDNTINTSANSQNDHTIPQETVNESVGDQETNSTSEQNDAQAKDDVTLPEELIARTKQETIENSVITQCDISTQTVYNISAQEAKLQEYAQALERKDRDLRELSQRASGSVARVLHLQRALRKEQELYADMQSKVYETDQKVIVLEAQIETKDHEYVQKSRELNRVLNQMNAYRQTLLDTVQERFVQVARAIRKSDLLLERVAEQVRAISSSRTAGAVGLKVRLKKSNIKMGNVNESFNDTKSNIQFNPKSEPDAKLVNIRNKNITRVCGESTNYTNDLNTVSRHKKSKRPNSRALLDPTTQDFVQELGLSVEDIWGSVLDAIKSCRTAAESCSNELHRMHLGLPSAAQYVDALKL